MRELDHLRKDGWIAAWKAMGLHLQREELKAREQAKQREKVVTGDFQRDMRRELFLKRRA